MADEKMTSGILSPRVGPVEQAKVYGILSTHGDPVKIAVGLGELIEAAKVEQDIAMRMENMLIDVAQGKRDIGDVFDLQITAHKTWSRLRAALSAMGV